MTEITKQTLRSAMNLLEENILDECSELGITDIFILYNFHNIDEGRYLSLKINHPVDVELKVSWIGIFFANDEDRNLYRLIGRHKNIEGLLDFELSDRYKGDLFPTLRNERALEEYFK